MKNNLSKGITVIFSANVINMIFNILTSFLLPKYLSVETYASIKTFQLYTTYIGVLALGYADGTYLRFGGRELSGIDKGELSIDLSTLRIILLLESLILVPAAWLSGDRVLFCVSLTVLSMNMTGYYKNLYQAVGEFKRYGFILTASSVSAFVVNMILLFVVKTDNYLLYLLFAVVRNLVIWLWLERTASVRLRLTRPVQRFSKEIAVREVKSGFFLMVGNFSSILLTSMDRWFVKIMMNEVAFAYYSFAVSLEGFLNVAITPITATMYNYFCNHSGEEDVARARKRILLFGSIIIAAAFPAKWVIELFLPKYMESLNVLFFLFAAQGMFVVVKGVFINLYKALKRQRRYFIGLMIVLVIGAALNFLYVRVFPQKEAFAAATFCSALIWLIMCSMDLRNYRMTLKEWVYLTVELTAFLALGLFTSAGVGFVAYIGCTGLLMLLLMRDEMKGVLSMIGGILRKAPADVQGETFKEITESFGTAPEKENGQ